VGVILVSTLLNFDRQSNEVEFDERYAYINHDQERMRKSLLSGSTFQNDVDYKQFEKIKLSLLKIYKYHLIKQPKQPKFISARSPGYFFTAKADLEHKFNIFKHNRR
jgi:hypothetical protein